MQTFPCLLKKENKNKILYIKLIIIFDIKTIFTDTSKQRQLASVMTMQQEYNPFNKFLFNVMLIFMKNNIHGISFNNWGLLPCGPLEKDMLYADNTFYKSK